MSFLGDSRSCWRMFKFTDIGRQFRCAQYGGEQAALAQCDGELAARQSSASSGTRKFGLLGGQIQRGLYTREIKAPPAFSVAAIPERADVAAVATLGLVVAEVYACRPGGREKEEWVWTGGDGSRGCRQNR
ncbi:hypothetical protein C8J57DRAFT_1254406 [Mycena rebaudengoi]|nr:hypothetical protein C8J57DRAFT_1254406 [Mycena rebaudengoi]